MYYPKEHISNSVSITARYRSKNLLYFHVVQLLHKSFIILCNPVSIEPGIPVIAFDPRNICGQYELKIFPYCQVIAKSSVAMITVLP